MKTTIYYSVLLLAFVALFSCENTVDADLLANSETMEETHAVIPPDADSLGTISFMPETEEMKILKERLKEINKKLFRSARNYNNDLDPNFLSNMMAIRELPIYIKVRNQDQYLSSNGNGKELSLSNKAYNRLDEMFYLKMFAPSTGIPYMIYAMQTKTPIAVGQYDNNPNEKIVFAMKNDVTQGTSLFNATWDLIPSNDYKGYFAIQSQSYLGQSDPNDMWSVFNYVIEVKPDYKVRYGQYTKKAEQEFLITPVAQFELEDITFDANSAKVTEQSPLTVELHGVNKHDEYTEFTIEDEQKVDERCYFSEHRGIVFNLNNASSKLFKRPTVLANRFVPPTKETIADAPYKSSMNYIRKTLKLSVKGFTPPSALIKVTSYFKVYSVSANYTATAKYSDRRVKLSGVWSGIIYTTIPAKDNIVRYYDLITGEEIFMQPT